MPRPSNSPQQARAIETRRRLLEATVDCLVASGYAATTTSDVCTAAGVSQGALFKHFPSKAALLGAAVETLFARVADAFSRAIAEAEVDEDRPGRLLRLLDRTFREPQSLAAFELLLAARTDRALAEAIGPVATAHRAALRREACAAFGVEPGEDRDGEAFVQLLLSALQGRALASLGGQDSQLDVGEQLALYRFASRQIAVDEGDRQRS